VDLEFSVPQQCTGNEPPLATDHSLSFATLTPLIHGLKQRILSVHCLFIVGLKPMYVFFKYHPNLSTFTKHMGWKEIGEVIMIKGKIH
jgi:hypothetical protein